MKKIIIMLFSLTLIACGGGGGGGNNNDDVTDNTIPSYSISGSVSGLNGSLILQNNEKEILTISSNGTFSFLTPVVENDTYNVTITSQPNSQTCEISNASGGVAQDVTDINVSCNTKHYLVGGIVSGLTGILVLQNNGADDLSLSTNGNFNFSSKISHGSTYNISIRTQPDNKYCSIFNGSGSSTDDINDIQISCLTSLSKLGSIGTGQPQKVITQGGYAYIAAGGGLHIMDVTNPVNPVSLSFFHTPSYAINVTINGNYAFIIDYYGDLLIVDISIPSDPRLTATYAGTPGLLYMAIKDNYAYLTNTFYLEIIDISDPANPTFVKRYNDLHGHITIHDNYAYFMGPKGFIIADISDPVNPTEIGSYNIDFINNGSDLVIRGDFAYIGNEWKGLKIIDISDPTNPSLVTNYDVPDSEFINIVSVDIRGNYAYLGDERNGLHIIDISAPDAPSSIGHISTPGNPPDITFYNPVFGKVVDIELIDNYAYMADSNSNMHIIDITNLTSPEPSNTYNILSTVEAIAMDGNYAYLASHENGLRIIDVTDQSTPVKIGSYDSLIASDVIVQANYAYVASSNHGLHIFDISDPAIPQEIGEYRNSSGRHITSIVLRDNYAFVAFWEGGLATIDISDPTNPIQTEILETSGISWDIKLKNDYAYIADNNRLEIIDISDPNNLTRAGSVYITGSAQSLELHDNYAYVTAQWAGLKIVDISDPTTPFIATSYEFPDNTWDITISDQYAYVANGNNGLQVLNVNDPTSPTQIATYLTSGDVNTVFVAEDKTIYVGLRYFGLEILEMLQIE